MDLSCFPSFSISYCCDDIFFSHYRLRCVTLSLQTTLLHKLSPISRKFLNSIVTKWHFYAWIIVTAGCKALKRSNITWYPRPGRAATASLARACQVQSGMSGLPVAVRACASLLGRWLLPRVRQHSTLSAVSWRSDLCGTTNTQQLRRQKFCSRWTSLVELSSGPSAQSRHHLRTCCSAEGTPFSGSMNAAALWLLICGAFKTLTYLLPEQEIIGCLNIWSISFNHRGKNELDFSSF